MNAFHTSRIVSAKLIFLVKKALQFNCYHFKEILCSVQCLSICVSCSFSFPPVPIAYNSMHMHYGVEGFRSDLIFPVKNMIFPYRITRRVIGLILIHSKMYNIFTDWTDLSISVWSGVLLLFNLMFECKAKRKIQKNPSYYMIDGTTMTKWPKISFLFATANRQWFLSTTE